MRGARHRRRLDRCRSCSEALTQGGDALSVAVGPATTNTFADAATVTSEAGTAKTVINILNRDRLQLAPVMVIEVLPSAAKVVRNKVDGAIISQGGTPAALRITVAPDIVALTGLPASIEVGNNEQLAALRDSGLFDANGCVNPGAAIPAPLNALVCIKLATVEKYNRNGVVGVEATTLGCPGARLAPPGRRPRGRRWPPVRSRRR